METQSKRIEVLLRDIAHLERQIPAAGSEKARIRLERSLKTRLKRLEFLIPYSFRRELNVICQSSGIESGF